MPSFSSGYQLFATRSALNLNLNFNSSNQNQQQQQQNQQNQNQQQNQQQNQNHHHQSILINSNSPDLNYQHSNQTEINQEYQTNSPPTNSNSPRFPISLTSLISRSRPRRASRDDHSSDLNHLLHPISPTEDRMPNPSSNNHNNQPSTSVPPTEERSKTTGYFPVLRRMQSRRRDKENTSGVLATAATATQPTNTNNNQASGSGLRLPRNRRSMSQPPPIPNVIRSATDRLRSHHGSSASPPMPPPINPLAASHPAPMANLRNNLTVADLTAIQPDPNTLTTTPQPTMTTTTPAIVNEIENNTNTTAETSEQGSGDHQLYSLRLVPHLDASRSLHFEPIERKLKSSSTLKIGRFTDRTIPNSDLTDFRIAFKSKVVSRGHADIFTDQQGNFFIKDTKSSSGTFLNHIRLSSPGGESKPFPLRDGDVLQLGVDYQGGTEEIYRCVKMRVELNRGWQRSANKFNQQALAQLRALGGDKTSDSPSPPSTTNTKPQASIKPVSDCCICLFGVTVCQALFIAPCSHVYHFKCIRPLLQMHHPGFSCPLCRTFADLEADVETEPEEVVSAPPATATATATVAPAPVPVSAGTGTELPALEEGDREVLIDEPDHTDSAPMDLQQTVVSAQASALDQADDDVVMEDRTLATISSPERMDTSTEAGTFLSRQDTLNNIHQPRRLIGASTNLNEGTSSHNSSTDQVRTRNVTKPTNNVDATVESGEGEDEDALMGSGSSSEIQNHGLNE
ncbi:hypothetical protein CROQUDRAFT_97406 [Cronartium quercuum f. sp. fusiforme G11]|uniref:Uncharacterized protein n=1 Tax=Cronartium quercuum f. sp. fusiforme G11 TaxID=708437 RepID=A0A9P6N9M2_9BASI|nr:hypothetical protein CROQUDRAFT_97406 [Cronartium quercuum f. sp. fusiforme G11]